MSLTDDEISLALIEIGKQLHHIKQRVAILEMKEAAKHSITNKVQSNDKIICPICRSSKVRQWINHPEHGYQCIDCCYEWTINV